MEADHAGLMYDRWPDNGIVMPSMLAVLVAQEFVGYLMQHLDRQEDLPVQWNGDS